MMVVMERKSLPLHKYPVNEPVPFETGSLDEMSAGARAGYPHRHDFHEILYITRGTGAHVIDLIPYPVEPPVLFFVSPGQVHFWEQGATIAGRVLIFTMEFLVHDPTDQSLFSALSFLTELEQAPRLLLDHDQASIIERLLTDLADEYNERELRWSSAVHALLHVLLIKLQRMVSLPADYGSRASAIVRRFKKLVSRSCTEQRSVHAYARMIGISRTHLAETIKLVTGSTPSEIIQEQLILEAKRLLAHSEIAIGQIGHRLGFEDPAYFGRYFRRKTGSSPGKFRRDFRQKYHNLRPLPLFTVHQGA
jgi:AraC-like DNA-binding protein